MFTPLINIVFLSVTLVNAVPVEVPELPIRITFGVVVLVFVIVKSLVVPPAVFDPSIVTYFDAIFINAEVAALPLIVAVTPLAGLIVKVLVALAELFALIIIGKVSLIEYVAAVRLNITGPVMQALLIAVTAAVSVA